MVQQQVDETLLVSEEEIASAMVFALRVERLVVEGGGAVGLAAALSGKAAGPWQNVAVVVSGGNADMDVLQRLAGDAAGG